jgi:hypothetical protein
MKTLNLFSTLIVVFFIYTNLVFSQTIADSINITWTKYIIINDKSEVLLRYVETFKAWELTGCGYEGSITLKNLMDSVAIFLGIKYDSYKLGGMFTYTKPGRYRATIKPYFIVHFTGYINEKYFTDTLNTKWVSIQEAKKIIPYPTMVMILDQLIKFPNNVWGGAFEEYNYSPPTATKWKVIEPFYKLN